MKSYAIKYAPNPNGELTEYLGIGGRAIDPQDPESTLLPSDQTEEGWSSFLHYSGPIEILETLSYFLINKDRLGVLPEKLGQNVLTNLDRVASIVSHWFIPDSAVFRFLDLINDGVWDDLTSEEQLEDQSTKYTFNHGSTIIINEDITPKHQYFIPVDRIDQLIEDTSEIYKILYNEITNAS